MREAMYQMAEKAGIRCSLCPRMCLLHEGESGFCMGRKVIQGRLIATNYARVAAMALDPIEKKPLYHYHPGSQILSLGPNSCNLNCSFCQNWEISRAEVNTEELTLDKLYSLVHRQQTKQVAFTYTEPLMWYEYIWDFVQQYPEIEVVLVTNGYLNQEPWEKLLPHIAAMNIDLKSIREEFYKAQCGGNVQNVTTNIQLAHKAGVHIELTCLLIPGLNDNPEEINALAAYIASIDKDIPLHISAYHPAFRMHLPATTAAQVRAACDIASVSLSHVYAGNVFISEYSRRV